MSRILNVPNRGIGQATRSCIMEYQQYNMCSLFQALANAPITGRVKTEVDTFLAILDVSGRKLRLANHADHVELLLQTSGYINRLRNKDPAEANTKLDNIQELISAIRGYDNIFDFIDNISLANINMETGGEDDINIMTIHASKGLEFDVVFLPGWEEGIFPSPLSLEEKGNTALEEERRLAYVAITRAREKVFISSAVNRHIHNQYKTTIPSRFLRNIPADNVNFRDFVTRIKPTPMPRTDALSIKVGSKVRHSKFGVGVVLDKNSDVLKIRFQNRETRSILESYVTEVPAITTNAQS